MSFLPTQRAMVLGGNARDAAAGRDEPVGAMASGAGGQRARTEAAAAAAATAALSEKLDGVVAAQTRLRVAFADMFKLVRGVQERLDAGGGGAR